MCNKRSTVLAIDGLVKPVRVDLCLRELIQNLNWMLKSWKTVACCCGHGKYKTTVMMKSTDGLFLEIFSDTYIKRNRNFYRKDKDGFYFIPETLKGGYKHESS